MQQLTTQELKQKISEGENFILDLFATWCGPCKIMLNNLNKLSETLTTSDEDLKSKYNIYKYDIDSDREYVMSELNIRSVPTIKMFKGGEEIFSKPGVMSPTELLELITKN